MTELWSSIAGQLSPERAFALSRAALLLILGFFAARLVSRLLFRTVGRRLDTQRAYLLRRASYYLLLVLFVVAALHELGFNLGILLGAAGVLSVAIGFASQTSASNIISGLFLIGERPFAIGDAIRVGGTTGEVLAIDLLSVKLRTFDNLFVRIPNETLIKTEVTNLSRFPIRRIDLLIGVGYSTDLSHARDVLMETAHRNPLSLEEPPPLFQVRGFGGSSLDLQFSVWVRREAYLQLKNEIQEEIKEAFDTAGIEIPFPQVVVHAPSGQEPPPVRLDRPPPAGAGDSDP